MLQTHSDHNKVNTQHCLIIDLTIFVMQDWSTTVEVRMHLKRPTRRWQNSVSVQERDVNGTKCIQPGPTPLLVKMIVNFAFHKGRGMS